MKNLLLGTTLALLAVSTVAVYAADKESKKVDLKGVKCVVSGKPAKDVDGSSVAFKVDGKEFGKVFFCCANCPKAYGKAPEKYANKAKLQLVATSQVEQVKCPLTGKDDPKVKVKVAGTEVLVCCNGCKGKLSKAEGDKQLALFFEAKCPFEKAFKAGKAKKDKKDK